jgi:secondary thiamine-phosphate synthase enzyme
VRRLDAASVGSANPSGSAGPLRPAPDECRGKEVGKTKAASSRRTPKVSPFFLVQYIPLTRAQTNSLRYKNFTIVSMYTIKVRSSAREELVEFTEQVAEKLKDSGEREGIVVLYVQHTTAGLTVNENADPDVPSDMLHAFRTLIPQHGMGFRHGEENSDAHIKATLVGSSVTIPFKDGKLLLGRWQGIFLCEFDGARERQVIMMVR